MFKLVCLFALMSFALATDKDPVFLRDPAGRYLVSTINLNYQQSFATCKRFGGHLATESSAEETDAINAMLTKIGATAYEFYIGGFRQTDGEYYPAWIWLDTGNEFTYTNWYSSVSNASTSYPCLYRRSMSSYSGRWDTTTCASVARYICKLV